MITIIIHEVILPDNMHIRELGTTIENTASGSDLFTLTQRSAPAPA